MSLVRVKVVQATKSPMNPRRWLLTFSCGHELWVSTIQRRKPQKTSFVCQQCPLVQKEKS